MTTDTVLFLLRIISATTLFGLLIAVLWFLWQDFRATAVEVEARKRRQGQLLVVKSEDPVTPVNTSFPLLPLTSIGRAPTNTIVLADNFASAAHALIVLRSGQWWLEDRGSANGTSLNGDPLLEPTVVSSGDVVGIGTIELKLMLE
jgi:hypothetical protein